MRGIPSYVSRLCRHLPPLRPHYHFSLFINRAFQHNELPENYHERLEQLKEQPNIQLININHDAEIFWEQVLLPRALKKHGIHLLHMPANRISFIPKIPVVATIHDIMEFLFLRKIHAIPDGADLKMKFYYWRKQAYVWMIYKLGLRKAARIVTVSNYSARDLKRHLVVPEAKIACIYHGVDSHFKSLQGRVLTGPDKRRYCLMFGGDSYQKNSEGALAAWSRVPSSLRRRYPLRIIGFCGRVDSPLLRLIKQLGLEKEVAVAGWVSEETLVRHLQEAALLLFMSRYEGFGFPIVQAMACGTPVVCSNSSSLIEVGGEAAMTFSPDDASGTAGGIVTLLSDHEKWQLYVQKGLQRAKEFTWQKSAQEHLRVYERELGLI
jgi:glycosyltransferase involved in cell wall biosynthesis